MIAVEDLHAGSFYERETMSETFTIDLPDIAATEAFGRRLGHLLFPGAVVALVGPLGAGKTHLVRAVAEGLDIADSRVVSSPTFVLIQEYMARLPIYHFDAYRLRSEAEFYDLGGHEYFAGDGVCLIEWADRVLGCLPRDRLLIRLEVTGEQSRRAALESLGDGYADLIRSLQARPDSGPEPWSER
jgi:tRNA threonylcarbamoyladenosine biosynthesis protein TsaE